MSPRQGALLSQCGLRSLLEAAAVCYAPENCRDELGIVHIAETVEELILIAKVQIQSCVKRVAVLTESWGSLEVGGKRPVLWRGIEIQQRDGVWVQTACWKYVEGTAR